MIFMLDKLSTCDTEPVAFINQIQPFGALLIIDKSLTIVQASENIGDWLSKSITKVVGQPANTVFNSRHLSVLHDLSDGPVGTSAPIGLLLGSGHAIAQKVTDEYLLVEVESRDPLEEFASTSFKTALNNISKQRSIDGLADTLASCIHSISGYNRVMIYRFHSDWHGEVIAEAKDEGVDGYLGHHFPASDIPAPARRLFSTNWIRLIADVSARPVGLSPRTIVGKTTDLTYSSLRQASPIHIEYLRNMNVGASLTISIMLKGQLWGLVACHHEQPRYLDYWTRSMCELLGKHASAQLARVVDEQANALAARISRVAEKALFETPVKDALRALQPELKKVLRLSAVVFFAKNGEVVRANGFPEDRLDELKQWLEREGPELYHSECIHEQFPNWANIPNASGVAAVRTPAGYLVALRPEILQTITWGGDPRKPVTEGQDRLHPRASFAAFVEKAKGRSEVWRDSELQALSFIAQALATASELKRADKLADGLEEEVRERIEQAIGTLGRLAEDPRLDAALKLRIKRLQLQHSEALEAMLGPEKPAS